MSLIIGVDFDNTLVSYDELIHRVAVQQALIDGATPRDKRQIRDQIRELPNGEQHWQRLQATVYGPRMAEACLIDGVEAFFAACLRREIEVYIISHKTQYAAADNQTDLRLAASRWMRQHGFFVGGAIGLREDAVFFEPTRREKVERIAKLGCTHFVDDLEETFLEPSFPEEVRKFLFAPHQTSTSLTGVRLVHGWSEIVDELFHCTV